MRAATSMAGPNLRTFVIANPVSAACATGRRWRRIARAIGDAVGSFDHGLTEAPRHATALARKAIENGYELIVAVGGDGTLNEVACGFFDDGRPVARDRALGLVPHGTGSDFARTLGIERSLAAACARLAGRATRLVDVGAVRFVGHGGRLEERVFVNAASFGCGGAVAHAMTTAPKWLGGKLAFMLTTASVLRRYRDQRVVVAVDGEAGASMAVTAYAVCNGQYFGGGMWVAPRAELADGRLDVTIWSGIGLRDFIVKRKSLYDGRHVDDPGTRTRRAAKVVAVSGERVPLEIDGESAGWLPATFEIVPSALRIKV